METPLWAGKLCQVLSGDSCPAMSLQALLAQLSSGEACAECAPPGSLGQMPAEPSTVAGIPSPLVLFLSGQPCSQPAVELEEAISFPSRC